VSPRVLPCLQEGIGCPEDSLDKIMQSCIFQKIVIPNQESKQSRWCDTYFNNLQQKEALICFYFSMLRTSLLRLQNLKCLVLLLLVGTDSTVSNRETILCKVLTPWRRSKNARLFKRFVFASAVGLTEDEDRILRELKA
jgi:hypothetical protein